MSTTVAAPARSRLRAARPWLIGAAVVLVIAAAIGIPFAAKYWPYRYREIKPLLENVFGSQVAIKQYHRTYFPNPGFVATGITIRRKSAPDQPPIGTVQTLFVQGRWSDLLTLRRRVQLVDMTGVHMVLPPPGSHASQEDFPPGSPMDFTGPDTMIERLEVHNSVLDVLRTNGSRFSFPVHQLELQNFQKGRTVSYVVSMENAMPSGHIIASGKFGPLNGQQLEATEASGKFTYTQVNLHDLGNVRGTVSASGQFKGTLSSLAANATANIPDFAVDDAQSAPVAGAVQCTINALNGEVKFQSIDLRTGMSSIEATGGVEGSPKSTNLDVVVKNGRAEDLLRPFLKAAVPITGPVVLHSHIYLAPSGEDFFKRLHVDGAFDVPAERVTYRSTEKSLSAFSERAQGIKAPDPSKGPQQADQLADAVSSVKGPATIRNAIVTTHNLTFQVAGAQATLDGTFNLHTSAAHLTGKLTMQSDISHAATGFKSVLLKPLAPFFKKKKAGAVVSIAVTGTPGHYQVSQDILHTK